jgi:ABC-type dipeptide/oligopeptide/nickel transport system permease subunit
VRPRVRAPGVVASGGALGLLALCAAFGGYLARTFPEGSEANQWLLGARATTITVSVVTLIALTAGLAFGAAAALGPKVLDSLLSRAMELAAALPSVIVALIVSRVAPDHVFLAVPVTLALLRGLETAKIVRADLKTLATTEFVLAARALGSGQTRLFRAHLLPHVIDSALASATLTAAAVMGLEAALSFLGLASLGPSWGALLAQAVERGAPGLALGPALGVAITLLSLYVLGAAIEARASVGRRFI